MPHGCSDPDLARLLTAPEGPSPSPVVSRLIRALARRMRGRG